MSLTAAQKQAIAARGNVLVMAGAGTGKTRTLVERCIDCLIHERPPVSLDEILLVTFTEAAAAEMRERIRARLEEELSNSADRNYWEEQLAHFENAKIGTLHSFCLHLVRQHFYELELDPQLVVLPEEEARLLAEETLDRLLEHYYEEKGEQADNVRRVIQAHIRGSDQPLRQLLLRIHKYSQSLPHPEGWLKEQRDRFSSEEPSDWRKWYEEALQSWLAESAAKLTPLSSANGLAAECLAIVQRLVQNSSPDEFSNAFASIKEAEERCPRNKKKEWSKPLADFFSETAFLASLLPQEGGPDPLKEDWEWARGEMLILLQLTAEFSTRFGEAKRELGVVDFSDLEQHTLRLLWDHTANKPTPTAEHWREQLRFVFVDEYQDINAAQDCIIRALSKEGAGNRFLVGDVKQSIYRFRLANPHIFQSYLETWGRHGGSAIALQENFRSRKEILEFVNSISESWMRPELGGLSYDEKSRLISGLQERDFTNASPLAVELRLRVKGNVDEEDSEPPTGDNSYTELEEAAKEARLVGARLQELVDSGHLVWDEQTKGFRAVKWRDIAILLRSPSNKAESYAREFALLGLPLQVARGGFYDSIEISDLLSVLKVLDNPLQDIPLLAVLRSPLVGLSLNELAEIRLALPRGYFWAAVLRWADVHVHGSANSVTGDRASPEEAKSPEPIPDNTQPPASPLAVRISMFLDRFARWRRLARQVALSECLEHILNETRYADFLSGLSRAQQRLENVQRFIVLAQRFDQLQRQGLFRFLRLIEAQREVNAEPEASNVEEENAVRLMSIHQSKGLEFPVVVVADLGKPFNFSDLWAEVILDEDLGLCPQIRVPNGGGLYPSLAHWLAARHQRRELLGEELRLLYVAMTRARDLLILSGTTSKSAFERIWQKGSKTPALAAHKARSFADWIGGWFRANAQIPDQREGESALFRWNIHDDQLLASVQTAPPPEREERTVNAVSGQTEAARQPFLYPFLPATVVPAKASVSSIRRQAWAAERDDSISLVPTAGSIKRSILKSRALGNGVEIGNAHHHFLERVDLVQTGSESELQAEAQRLLQDEVLTEQEVSLLDFAALGRFWNSEVGCQIRSQARHVRREVPFTFRLGAAELVVLTRQKNLSVAGLADDFVVVQGVADLIVVLPGETWLLDFKTDHAEAGTDHAAKYEVQVRLYAEALAALYKRPVTNAWLHFLATGETVRVQLNPPRAKETSAIIGY